MVYRSKRSRFLQWHRTAHNVAVVTKRHSAAAGMRMELALRRLQHVAHVALARRTLRRDAL